MASLAHVVVGMAAGRVHARREKAPRVFPCEEVAYRDFGFNIRGDLRIASPDDSTVKCVAATSLAPGKSVRLKSCAAVDVQKWTWTGAPAVSDVPFPDAAVELALADWAGFARKGDGTVWSWGRNDHGELGPGSYAAMPRGPSPVSGLGSKMGIDATNKWPGETTREWGRPIAMDADVKARVDVLWRELFGR